MTNPKQSKTLHIETLGEELSVYDWKRLQMHSLNPTAAKVFVLCDGTNSPAAMAIRLAMPEAGIWQALTELEKANLLQVEAEKAFWQKDISRRQFLKAGSAVAAAAIVSIMLPSPAAAQSAPATATPTTTPPTPTPTTTPPTLPATRGLVIGTTGGGSATHALSPAIDLSGLTPTLITYEWTGDPSPSGGSSYLQLKEDNVFGGPGGDNLVLSAGSTSPQTSTDSGTWTSANPFAYLRIGAGPWNIGTITITIS